MRTRTLTVFSLAMIHIATLGTVKNWPLIAESGPSSIFYLMASVIFFLLPVALVAAELATTYPKLGGVFVWIKEAFGHRSGLVAVWLLWIENVIWYPTVLSFIGGTLAYLISPDLASNGLYMGSVVLVVFWGATIWNLRGMRISAAISTWSILLGSIIPGLLIYGLGIFFLMKHGSVGIHLQANELLPPFHSINELAFFSGVLLTLAGIEMPAVHARDVENPQRNYPKAIFIAFLVIAVTTLLGVFCINAVVPHGSLSLVAGSLQAFTAYLSISAPGLEWAIPILAVLIALSAFGTMSTWIAGPTRGLLAAAEVGDLPAFFHKTNRHEMPVTLMIVQAIVVSFLALLFVIMPNINAAYWLLSALASQLYLVMYLILFAAAIRLRYLHPNIKRPFAVPGGNVGMWTVAGIGALSSLIVFIFGFLPPPQVATGSPTFFISFMVIGTIALCLFPLWLFHFRKKSLKS